jgi:hypothetical protein
MALKRQIENENTMAHLQGAYIRDALVSTLGNMFSGKHSQRFDYPDKPYDLNLDNKRDEREKESQIELFTASLNTAMHNFNLQKQDKG